jgi:hypothetical protein
MFINPTRGLPQNFEKFPKNKPKTNQKKTNNFLVS